MSSTPKSVKNPAIATSEAAQIVLGVWVETYNLADALVRPNMKDNRKDRRALDDDAAEEYMAQLTGALMRTTTEVEKLVSDLGIGSREALAFQRILSYGPELSDVASPGPDDRQEWIEKLTALKPHHRDTAVVGAISPSFLAFLRCFNLGSASDAADTQSLETSVQQRVHPAVRDALGSIGSPGHRYFHLGRQTKKDIGVIGKSLNTLKVNLVLPVVRAAIDANGPFLRADEKAAFIERIERPTRRRTLSEIEQIKKPGSEVLAVLDYGPKAAWSELAARPNAPLAGHAEARKLMRSAIEEASRAANRGGRLPSVASLMPTPR